MVGNTPGKDFLIIKKTVIGGLIQIALRDTRLSKSDKAAILNFLRNQRGTHGKG